MTTTHVSTSGAAVRGGAPAMAAPMSAPGHHWRHHPSANAPQQQQQQQQQQRSPMHPHHHHHRHHSNFRSPIQQQRVPQPLPRTPLTVSAAAPLAAVHTDVSPLTSPSLFSPLSTPPPSLNRFRSSLPAPPPLRSLVAAGHKTPNYHRGHPRSPAPPQPVAATTPDVNPSARPEPQVSRRRTVPANVRLICTSTTTSPLSHSRSPSHPQPQSYQSSNSNNNANLHNSVNTRAAQQQQRSSPLPPPSPLSSAPHEMDVGRVGEEAEIEKGLSTPVDQRIPAMVPPSYDAYNLGGNAAAAATRTHGIDPHQLMLDAVADGHLTYQQYSLKAAVPTMVYPLPSRLTRQPPPHPHQQQRESHAGRRTRHPVEERTDTHTHNAVAGNQETESSALELCNATSVHAGIEENDPEGCLSGRGYPQLHLSAPRPNARAGDREAGNEGGNEGCPDLSVFRSPCDVANVSAKKANAALRLSEYGVPRALAPHSPQTLKRSSWTLPTVPEADASAALPPPQPSYDFSLSHSGWRSPSTDTAAGAPLSQAVSPALKFTMHAGAVVGIEAADVDEERKDENATMRVARDVPGANWSTPFSTPARARPTSPIPPQQQHEQQHRQRHHCLSLAHLSDGTPELYSSLHLCSTAPEFSLPTTSVGITSENAVPHTTAQATRQYPTAGLVTPVGATVAVAFAASAGQEATETLAWGRHQQRGIATASTPRVRSHSRPRAEHQPTAHLSYLRNADFLFEVDDLSDSHVLTPAAERHLRQPYQLDAQDRTRVILHRSAASSRSSSASSSSAFCSPQQLRVGEVYPFLSAAHHSSSNGELGGHLYETPYHRQDQRFRRHNSIQMPAVVSPAARSCPGAAAAAAAAAAASPAARGVTSSTATMQTESWRSPLLWNPRQARDDQEMEAAKEVAAFALAQHRRSHASADGGGNGVSLNKDTAARLPSSTSPVYVEGTTFHLTAQQHEQQQPQTPVVALPACLSPCELRESSTSTTSTRASHVHSNSNSWSSPTEHVMGSAAELAIGQDARGGEDGSDAGDNEDAAESEWVELLLHYRDRENEGGRIRRSLADAAVPQPDIATTGRGGAAMPSAEPSAVASTLAWWATSSLMRARSPMRLSAGAAATSASASPTQSISSTAAAVLPAFPHRSPAAALARVLTTPTEPLRHDGAAAQQQQPQHPRRGLPVLPPPPAQLCAAMAPQSASLTIARRVRRHMRQRRENAQRQVTISLASRMPTYASMREDSVR